MNTIDKSQLADLIMKETQTMCYLADIETYELAYMNNALKDSIGYSNDDDSYIGKKCYKVLQGKNEICEFCTNEKLEAGQFYEWGMFNERVQHYYNIKDTLVEIEDKKLRLEFIYENSKSDKKIQDLNRRLVREATLVKCAKTLTEKRDNKSTIEYLLKLVGEFYKANRVYIIEKEGFKGLISKTYKWHKEESQINDEALEQITLSVIERLFNEYDKNDRHGVISINNLDKESEHFKRLGKWNIKNLLVVTLKLNDKIIGFVGVNDATENLKDIELLKTISLFITDYLQKRKELYDLNNKLTSELVLVQCAQTLSADRDKKSAINKLLSLLGDYYVSDRAYITEISESGLLVVNTFEWCREGVEKQIENLKDIPYSTYRHWFDSYEKHGEYVMSAIASIEQTAADYELLNKQGIDSMITVPLIDRSKIIGYLGVDNPSENITDTSLLHSVALFVLDDIKKREILYKLEGMVYFDGLTGVWNRYKYHIDLKEIEESSESVGILYADIDGLRKKNDDYGNDYGDSIIKESVNILHKYFPNEIYRVGGDEFVVLSRKWNIIGFNQRVENLRIELKAQINISISVGHTWCNSAENIVKHIEHADGLMYINKQEYHKNRYTNSKNYRMDVASELQELIVKNQFIVVLQPKVALKYNNKVIGAEALVRRKDVGDKLISPDKFISIYETDGIIRYIDFFVLEFVCKLLRRWIDEGYSMIPISVNFSRITIMEYNIASSIKAICNNYNIPTELIVVELTERISNIKADSIYEILKSVKEEGFKISLDDFGAEYANLSILSKIDFDEIKLDKSLIDNVEQNQVQSTVLEYLVEMCNSINNTITVAEGIETEEQMNILRNANCEIAQGYYFDKPLTIEEFEKRCLEKKPL